MLAPKGVGSGLSAVVRCVIKGNECEEYCGRVGVVEDSSSKRSMVEVSTRVDIGKPACTDQYARLYELLKEERA